MFLHQLGDHYNTHLNLGVLRGAIRGLRSSANVPWVTLLALLALLVFWPIIFGGEVIAPHPNGLELGVIDPQLEDRIANRKFSDFSQVFIPEIHHHLHGNTQRWLSSWNPHNELGRASSQLGGLSRSYLLANVISMFVDDAHIFYTAHFLATLLILALSCFALLRFLGALPAAAFAGACGITFAMKVLYWSTFLMFLTPLAYALLILLGMTAWLSRKTLWGLAGVTYGGYALLMTGRPQIVVLYAYLITLAGIWGIRKMQKSGAVRRRAIMTSLACIAAAATVGGLLVL